MRLRDVLLASFLALAALSASQVLAQDTDAQLAAVREHVQQARFSDAVTAAQALLERSDLSPASRNAALELLAVAQLANRRADDADRTLQLLYSRDPGHRLSDPDASPPVLSAFARARESRPNPITVRLEHDSPTLTRREPPELTVRIAEGDDAVSEMRLVYRMGSESPSRVVMTRRADGTYVARIPVVGDASTATDVAYHLTAHAPSLAPLAEVGTAAEPLQLRIPAEAAVQATTTVPTPLPVAVAAGAVTTGILLGPAQEGPERGSLGSVRLMSIELP